MLRILRAGSGVGIGSGFPAMLRCDIGYLLIREVDEE